MRTWARSSMADLFHFAIAMITILAIAGTLSACGRYGSPVRSAPVEAGDEAGNEVGVEAESAAEVGKMDPASKDPSAEEESDREDEDEDDLAE